MIRIYHVKINTSIVHKQNYTAAYFSIYYGNVTNGTYLLDMVYGACYWVGDRFILSKICVKVFHVVFRF